MPKVFGEFRNVLRQRHPMKIEIRGSCYNVFMYVLHLFATGADTKVTAVYYSIGNSR